MGVAMRRISLLLALLFAVLALGFLAGCGKPGMAEDDSDLPWTTPESWESGPPIGLGN
jgi:hypothetical protein